MFVRSVLELPRSVISLPTSFELLFPIAGYFPAIMGRSRSPSRIPNSISSASLFLMRRISSIAFYSTSCRIASSKSGITGFSRPSAKNSCIAQSNWLQPESTLPISKWFVIQKESFVQIAASPWSLSKSFVRSGHPFGGGHHDKQATTTHSYISNVSTSSAWPRISR